MESVIRLLNWKGPPFNVVIQKNDNDGKYVYTDMERKYILKLEDMNKNSEGSENEKKVLEMLLHNPMENLPKPLKFVKTSKNINISVMINSGVSLDGKVFKQYFKKIPTPSDFLGATKSLVMAVHNLHSMGYIHRDITPGNVVCKGNKWTLIDFDFTVPFDYENMGNEVIINRKYDYIVHSWFLLDGDDNMIFDVERLKKYMHGTHVHWYMLIDYYAVTKVLLYNFNLLLSNDETLSHVAKDKNALISIINGNLTAANSNVVKVLVILYEIIGSFTPGSTLPNATVNWDSLLKLLGITSSRTSKRTMNDSSNIHGTIGKKSKTNKNGVSTYTLIK